MSAPNIVNDWVSHNSCSLDTSYSLLDINNDPEAPIFQVAHFVDLNFVDFN